MSPSEAFQLYRAIKSHFTTKHYDFFKYNGKVKIDWTKFDKRKDKYLYKKLGSHRNPIGFLVANFINNPHFWIGDIRTDSSHRNFLDWQRRIGSLSYTFKEDLERTNGCKDFQSLFIASKTRYPKILELYWTKKISIESMAILSKILKLFDHFDKTLKGDFLWDDTRMQLQKYLPFLKLDQEKEKQFLDLLKAHLKERQ